MDKPNQLPYANMRAWPEGQKQKDQAIAWIKANNSFPNFDQFIAWGISPLVQGMIKAFHSPELGQRDKSALIHFLEAIPVKADLSKVYFHFTPWMLTDSSWGMVARKGVDPKGRLATITAEAAHLCEELAKGKWVISEQWEKIENCGIYPTAYVGEAILKAHQCGMMSALHTKVSDAAFKAVFFYLGTKQKRYPAAQNKLRDLLAAAPVDDAT